MINMIIKVNPDMTPKAVIWVESPIVTPYNEQAVQARAKSLFIAGGVDGFVEFNVNLDKWSMEQDPNIDWDPTSKIINLLPPYNAIGFPLTDPGANPIFFDSGGNPI